MLSVSLALGCRGEPPPNSVGRLHAEVRRTPGPAPQERSATVSNANCVRCHETIAAEWAGSLHQRAWDDPTFLAAYAVEPMAFCRNCHAPEAASTEDERRHEGVSCVTCHVLARDVVGVRAKSGGEHPVLVEPAMATSDWCASCHEFDFPRPQEAKMQSTVSEHRRSAHRGRSCQACHMPEVTDAAGTHRRHDFRVQGDAALMASALSVTAASIDKRRVEVTLVVAEVGHAVPTGDLYRRLVVRATDANGQTARPVVLGRRFSRAHHPDGEERKQVGDDRVPPDGRPRKAELFFLQPFALPVRWEVVYQRMGPREAAVFGVDMSTDETVVSRGRIEDAKR